RRPRTGSRDGKRPRPASCSATSRLPATIRPPVTTLPESVTGSGTPASRHRSETTTARGAAERWLSGRSADFEQSGRPLAAADAHCHDHILHTTTASLDERVPDQPGSGHTVGVADRDAAAIDVVLLRIDAEAITAVQCLHRECFVELPQADVVDRQSVGLQQL